MEPDRSATPASAPDPNTCTSTRVGARSRAKVPEAIPTIAGAWASVANTPSRRTSALPRARAAELVHAAPSAATATASASTCRGPAWGSRRITRPSCIGTSSGPGAGRLRHPEGVGGPERPGPSHAHGHLVPETDVAQLVAGELGGDHLPVSEPEGHAREPPQGDDPLDGGPRGAGAASARADPDVVGPDEHLRVDPVRHVVGDRHPVLPNLHVPGDDLAAQHVRAPDEPGDERRGRLVVDLVRGPDLLDPALVHHD